MGSDRNSVSEFSRPVDLARLGDAGTVYEIEANAAERTALAERFGLIGIKTLRATVRLRRLRGGAAICLSGHLTADVTQTCVVSLAAVEQRVEEDFAVEYAEGATQEEAIIGADPDIAWPEPLPDGPLDIGEAVAQQLSLALDPYPRAEGVMLESGKFRETEGTPKPFARLAALRKMSHSSG